MDGRENCRLFDAELGDYLDGEMRPQVETHARECVFCAVVLADLASIRAAAPDLAVVEPPPRVWRNIRAALVEEGLIRTRQSFWRRFSKPGRLLAPAAAMAAAVLVVLGITFLRSSKPPAPGTVTARVVAPSPAVASVSSPAEDLQDMERSYEQQSASLDPVLRAEYEKGLKSLDGEIKDCLDSVQREPGNTLARDYLNAAYVQKAQTLESALESGGR